MAEWILSNNRLNGHYCLNQNTRFPIHGPIDNSKTFCKKWMQFRKTTSQILGRFVYVGGHKPCLVKANNHSKHVLAIFGSRCTHIPIAATVSAANLLSGSLT